MWKFTIKRLLEDDLRTVSDVLDPEGVTICKLLEPSRAHRLPPGNYVVTTQAMGLDSKDKDYVERFAALGHRPVTLFAVNVPVPVPYSGLLRLVGAGGRAAELRPCDESPSTEHMVVAWHAHKDWRRNHLTYCVPAHGEYDGKHHDDAFRVLYKLLYLACANGGAAFEVVDA